MALKNSSVDHDYEVSFENSRTLNTSEGGQRAHLIGKFV